jgi:hypothetical protein
MTQAQSITSQIVPFFYAHQVLVTLGAGYLWSSFISALPAPQATSSTMYRFFFTFLNVLAANISRANSTKVESSPNFQAAVNNLPGPVDKPVVIVEAPKAKP